MLEDYLTFNAAKFVKDYYRALKSIEGLQRQLEDVNFISALNMEKEKVKVSPSGSPVEAAVLRREAIESRIADYQWHIDTYQNAEKRLLPDEKLVLDTFFQTDNKLAAIATLEHQGFPRRTAYTIRKEALEKISLSVAGISQH